MSNAPFFSIVIPTKDRPAVLANALKSLSMQSFKDFEVIISDNYTTDSCKDVTDSFVDKLNIKYYKPDRFLSMTENFIFSFSKATGLFKTILEDKMMLYPFALSYAHGIFARRKDIEFISYPFDYFFWKEKSLSKYHYNAKTPKLVCLKTTIKPFINFEPASVMCGSSADSSGQLIAGFYAADLIERAKLQAGGELFLPPSPDLAAQTFISLVAKKGIYTGFPLANVYNDVKFCTGKKAEFSAEFMKVGWPKADPEGIANPYIPYPEFTASMSNSLASSFGLAIAKSTVKSSLRVDKHNLLFRINEDFRKQHDKDFDQVRILNEKMKLVPFYKKFLNYIKVKYGLFFNRNIVPDYIGINLWPFFYMDRYKILKKHRQYVKDLNYVDLSCEEALSEADSYYKKSGLLDYKI